MKQIKFSNSVNKLISPQSMTFQDKMENVEIMFSSQIFKAKFFFFCIAQNYSYGTLYT